MENQKKSSTEVIKASGLEAFFEEESKSEKKEVIENEDDKKQEEKSSLEDSFKEDDDTKKSNKTDDTKKDIIEGNGDDLFKSNDKSEYKKENKGSDLSSFYSNLIKEYVEDGDWVDADVEIEVDGETKTIPLTELEDLTPDKFKELKEQQKKLREEEFNSKYISSEGLDERTLEMIKLKKAGGDISTLIKEEAKIVNPLDKLDLKNEQVQEYLVREKMLSQGYENDYIDHKISKLKESLTLDSESDKIVEEVKKNFDAKVKSEAERQKKLIESRKEAQKEFRKTMSSAFKNFDLKESKYKTLLESSTSQDENGLSEVDKAFFAAKEDPEFFAELTHMLIDKESFKKSLGVKISNEVKKDTVKTILSLKRKTNEKSNEPKPKKQGLEAMFDD